MSTRLPSHKSLSKALALLAVNIEDPEVRDAFAYVADFLHQSNCSSRKDYDACVRTAEAYQYEVETEVSKALQPRLEKASA